MKRIPKQPECCDRRSTVAAIREGLKDVKAGRVRPASEVIDELRNCLTRASASNSSMTVEGVRQ